MFDMKRPCVSCPFRRGMGERFQLRPQRLQSIKRANSFQCHKTVDYDEDGDGEPGGDKAQQCVGLMAVLHRIKLPNQIMQIAERLGGFNPETLDPDGEAYADWREVLDAHLGPRQP